MPIYVVEAYLADGGERERENRVRRSRRAAAELTREGRMTRFLELLFIPGDEICLVRFEAECGDLAELAARRAGLDPLRVVCAIPSSDGTTRT